MGSSRHLVLVALLAASLLSLSLPTAFSFNTDCAPDFDIGSPCMQTCCQEVSTEDGCCCFSCLSCCSSCCYCFDYGWRPLVSLLFLCNLFHFVLLIATWLLALSLSPSFFPLALLFSLLFFSPIPLRHAQGTFSSNDCVEDAGAEHGYQCQCMSPFVAADDNSECNCADTCVDGTQTADCGRCNCPQEFTCTGSKCRRTVLSSDPLSWTDSFPNDCTGCRCRTWLISSAISCCSQRSRA